MVVAGKPVSPQPRMIKDWTLWNRREHRRRWGHLKLPVLVATPDLFREKTPFGKDET